MRNKHNCILRGLMEYKSFYKTVGGNEGNLCHYPTRLDTYGCGCQHDCSYCYAKGLLSFRKLWNAEEPSIADINKIERKLKRIPAGTILRLGGMTDCFQPLEKTEKVTYRTIELLNKFGIGYLIVTKSAMVADPEYLELYDPKLAHIQVTVTTLDDKLCATYEKASPPSERIRAIKQLKDRGIDVAIRLSPLIEEYMDFDLLNSYGIEKGVVEFLRVNSWIEKWFELDYSRYTEKQGSYRFLPLEEKQRVLDKVQIPEITVCEDFKPHYDYWKEHFNPNKEDCCNLRT